MQVRINFSKKTLVGKITKAGSDPRESLEFDKSSRLGKDSSAGTSSRTGCLVEGLPQWVESIVIFLAFQISWLNRKLRAFKIIKVG